MKVHILGGGIGGMSCALHLALLRDEGHLPPALEIHMWEKSKRLGGKAASQFGSERTEGNWPGEHGFRFFPNFYRCIVDTLARIRLTKAYVEQRGISREYVGRNLYDILKEPEQAGVALGGVVHAFPRAQDLSDLPRSIRTFFRAFGVPLGDTTRFAYLVTRFLTSCHDRALEEFEDKTLEQVITPQAGYGQEIWRFLKSLRALSAMRANRGSVRTLFFTAVQLLADFDPANPKLDALLPGPTDWLMLEPWEAELRRRGVEIHFEHTLEGLRFAASSGLGVDGRLASASLRRADGSTVALQASDEDFFVLAVPYEVAYARLRDAENLPEALQGIRRIHQHDDNIGEGAEPMVGVQYWLKRDVPVVHGHVLYPDSPWAMTSISQAQFWQRTFDRDLESVFQAPDLRGIWSAIISAWDEPGSNGKSPMQSTEAEIAEEAFSQLTTALGLDLRFDRDVLDYNVDRDIEFRAGQAHCPTPLWVSPAGSYLDRPLADPGLRNFFIASDWARTETDVGSMESADEAARLAVAGIAAEAPDPPDPRVLPQVRPLRLWPVVERLREADRWLYHKGLPHVLDIPRRRRLRLHRFLRLVRDGARPEEAEDALALLRTEPGLEKLDLFGAGVPDRGWLDDANRLSAVGGIDSMVDMLEVLDRLDHDPEADDPEAHLEEILDAFMLLG
jgi:15-cis-phytoene desaturase